MGRKVCSEREDRMVSGTSGFPLRGRDKELVLIPDNAQAILEALRAGTMPCDGPWSSDKVDRFARWFGSGMAD
jgi:hypothetical protein